ncbi:sensor histidine kinase [Thalassotalea mangrovi]|uniref:histidine kinase n=1 Tax=Thalassotalea mangrovi TaxID=2572245 RepID=A0A4U1B4R1_9GAMM|nr:HAMP domain-containing sensor histidine kinase [Thalassotalea mangrovi]TKB45156.1 HAMP domain-containing histidine kinase [Thalassotalea mangrovi]
MPGAKQGLSTATNPEIPTHLQSDGNEDPQSLDLSALLLESNQLNQLFDVMPAGVVIIDGDGKVVKANTAAKSMLGCQLLERNWISVISEVFNPRADDGHEVSLRNGRRVKLDISSFDSQAGQLIQITDLTETRILQEKISQMQRLSSLGRMVSTLAHQIRTPLSSAMLYCANLNAKNMTPAKQQLFQEKLQARLQELEQQVNDMLLYAKSGGKQVVEVVEVKTVIDDAVAGIEAQLNEAAATCEIEYQPHRGEPLKLLANKAALEGAIQNLMQNALEVINDNAHINIRVEAEGDWILIWVKDNGDGIAIEDKDKIFEPFYTSKMQGTGLGLAVVKSVAKAHHGDVSLNAESNGGAEFCLKLPQFKTEHKEIEK